MRSRGQGEDLGKSRSKLLPNEWSVLAGILAATRPSAGFAPHAGQES